MAKLEDIAQNNLETFNVSALENASKAGKGINVSL
jgi:hypothetical protein